MNLEFASKRARLGCGLSIGNDLATDGTLFLICLIFRMHSIRFGIGWDKDLPLSWLPRFRIGERMHPRMPVKMREHGVGWLGLFVIIENGKLCDDKN